MTKISKKARNEVFAHIERTPEFVISPHCKQAPILRQFEDEGLIRITEISGSVYDDGLWRISRSF